MGGIAAKTKCPTCGGTYPVKDYNRKDPNRRYHQCNDCGHRGITLNWAHVDRSRAEGRHRTPEERAEFDRKRAREFYLRMKGLTDNPLPPEKAEAIMQARREANRRYNQKKGHKPRVELTPEQKAEKEEARRERRKAKRAEARALRPPKPMGRPKRSPEADEAVRLAKLAKKIERTAAKEAERLARHIAKQEQIAAEKAKREADKAEIAARKKAQEASQRSLLALAKAQRAAEKAVEPVKAPVPAAILTRKKLEDYRLMKSLGLLDD